MLWLSRLPDFANSRNWVLKSDVFCRPCFSICSPFEILITWCPVAERGYVQHLLDKVSFSSFYAHDQSNHRVDCQRLLSFHHKGLRGNEFLVLEEISGDNRGPAHTLEMFMHTNQETHVHEDCIDIERTQSRHYPRDTSLICRGFFPFSPSDPAYSSFSAHHHHGKGWWNFHGYIIDMVQERLYL